MPRLLWLPLRVILTSPARPLRQHSNHMPKVCRIVASMHLHVRRVLLHPPNTRCVSLQAPAPGMEASCTLTTELEEGPYYLDDILFRSNITENQIGIPLVLRIKVVNTDCEPLADTFVDIWHCIGTGFYSGYTREPLVHLHHFTASVSHASTQHSPLLPNSVCLELCCLLLHSEAAHSVLFVKRLLLDVHYHSEIQCLRLGTGTAVCSCSEHRGCLLLSTHSFAFAYYLQLLNSIHK